MMRLFKTPTNTPDYCSAAPAADRQNRSFKALSGKGSVPAPPPPFRHTPFRPRPRHTAPVWRNPGRHPHRDGTFTFSAKERDSETGLSYFGSRYYSSDLSFWLSVDPMAAKYASLSPYVYCADNPVKLVDPDGDSLINPYKEAYDYFSKQYSEAKISFDSYGNNKGAVGYSDAQEALNKVSTTLDEVSKLYKTINNAISSLKKYNYALYEMMNNYTNNGNRVDIVVWINYSIDNEGWHVIPDLPDCPEQIDISLNPLGKIDRGYTDMGQVLSHELGHLLYILPNWSAYQKFLKSVGKNHHGHGHNDPSEEEADNQTRIYKNNKSRHN